VVGDHFSGESKARKLRSKLRRLKHKRRAKKRPLKKGESIGKVNCKQIIPGKSCSLYPFTYKYENMSSKTAKPKEKDLYAPYMEALKAIFDRYYVDESCVYSSEGLQKAPTNSITNPLLEITAFGEMPEELQRIFDYRLFAALYSERLKPDSMGFVRALLSK
jgi:hypothetical protein